MNTQLNVTDTEQVLISLIKSGSDESKRIRDLITTAKTKTKQTYYTKKLKKHNQKMVQLIMQLEAYQKMVPNTRTNNVE